MKKILVWSLFLLSLASPGYAQVVNGDFTSDVSGWSVVNGSIAWMTGVCELTRVSDASQYVYQDVPTEIGRTYRLRAYAKGGTSGADTGRLFARLATSPSTWSDTVVFTASTSAFVQYEVVFVAQDTMTRIYLNKYSAVPGTMLWDSVSLYKYPVYRVYYTDTLYYEYTGNITYIKSTTGLLTIKRDGQVIAEYNVGGWKWLLIL